MSGGGAFSLACMPAGFMFLFSLVGLGIHCPDTLAGALQHFAAGILLCTIGTELLPAMEVAEGLIPNVAAVAGFFTGVAVMLLLGILLPDHHDDHDDDKDNHHTEVHTHDAKNGDAPMMERANYKSSSNKLGRRESFRSIAQKSQSFRLTGENQPLRLGSLSTDEPSELGDSATAPQFPSVLVFAIAIDGMMDGVLIGIATAASASTGPMLAASLSVEMAFLGLTLSVALKGQGHLKSIVASMIGPIAIIFGATLGGLLAGLLSHNPVYVTFLLSFGTSALLFMVAEELLLEAHEKNDHVWWVDLQLYTGFYASIVMGKVLK